MKIGDYDESNPNGIGYRIMTPEGLKIFDLSEHSDYLSEKIRVRNWILSRRPAAAPRKRGPRDSTRQCRKCKGLNSGRCIPPVKGPCADFIRYNHPRLFHYA